jgi:MFS family permease
MAFAAPRLLPRGEDERKKETVPLVQILLILSGILMVSFAGTTESDTLRIILVTGGAASLAGLVVCERMMRARLLPRSAGFITHPLAQAYLAMFLLFMVLNSDIYIPYFLQTLHATSPLVAGYVVALVATGWTVAGLLTASWRGRKARYAMLAGPLVIAVSTFSLAFAIGPGNPDTYFPALLAISAALFGMGTGIGLGWAHLVSIALTRAESDEADKAPAAINLISSLAAAFGSATAGLIANASGLVQPGGTEGAAAAAFWLYGLFSVAGAVAILAVIPLFRMRDEG